MKTILEIQKLDRQIRALEREVDKCPASVSFRNYKKLLQDGRTRFEQLETQANDLITQYNIEMTKYNKCKGNSEIVRKRNTENIDLENIENLITDANALVGELSEGNRRVDDLVRKSEEIVRKSAELSNKLTEAKKRSTVIKAQIEQKKQEVAPKIAEIQKHITKLEGSITDKDEKVKYEKYKEMKANGIFPVYVPLEDVFCGGCKVELSLNFIEKLKEKKMLTCEHCGRIIML